MKKESYMGVFLLVLCSVATSIWMIIVVDYTDTHLYVTFLNVGQGDAVFIRAPSGRQVLIDGGPDRSVIRELGTVMPWYDRSIDLLIATHPDSDHINGLIDVLDRYNVSTIVRSDVAGDSPAAQLFDKLVNEKPATSLFARRGDILDLGEGTYVEILFPDRPVSGLDTNDASVVARLVYGDTSFMLTGDSPSSIETYLVRLDGHHLKSAVLKAGHHGSRTSTSKLFVGYVNPTYAVFSRGCDNRYGHPHQEVRDILAQFKTITKDTCQDGKVSFVSDGRRVWLKGAQLP